MPQEVAGCDLERRNDPSPTDLAAAGGPVRRITEADAMARCDFYRFLAAVFLGPPTPTLLREVADPATLAKLSRLFGNGVATKLEDFAASAEADWPSLKKEYMALFAVPTGRYLTPFEDAYPPGTAGDGGQERGLLLGGRAIAVKRLYRAAGAQMDRDCKELPTHIGVELSFMSFLCNREAKALRREPATGRCDGETEEVPTSECYRALQRRFLRNHLNDWFPRLGEAIRANTTSSFYRGMALLTEEFLAWDTAQLVSRSRSENRGAPA